MSCRWTGVWLCHGSCSLPPQFGLIGGGGGGGGVLAGKVSVLICDEWGWKDHHRGECLEVWGAAGLDGAHTAPRADG